MTRNALALGAALAALTFAPAALAQSQPGGGAPVTIQAVVDRPALTLSAHGEVKVAPDMATVSFGVVTEAATAQEAMAQNAARMAQVTAALRRTGIEPRLVQTSGLNLSAQYDYVENAPPRLRGYQASQRVTVIVEDLDATGRVVDAVVAAGVNQIDGIGFGLKDAKAAEDQARVLAVRALQDKAALYSQALGVPLGGIRSLTEGGGYAPPPPRPVAMYARAEMADAGTAVSPGELTVRIDVTGVYDLAQ
jgi:uncharacterized protein